MDDADFVGRAIRLVGSLARSLSESLGSIQNARQIRTMIIAVVAPVTVTATAAAAAATTTVAAVIGSLPASSRFHIVPD